MVNYNSVKFLHETNSTDNTYILNLKENLFDGDMKYILLSDSIITESCGNSAVLESLLLQEGVKLSKAFKNFMMKEGDEYESLRKDVRSILRAEELSDAELISQGKGLMHVCKRIVQVVLDLDAWVSIGGGIAATGSAVALVAATGAPGFTIFPAIAMLIIVINFIINRLLKHAVNNAEYNAIRKDAEDIINQLRNKAKKCKDPKKAKELIEKAEKLENKIKENNKKKK